MASSDEPNAVDGKGSFRARLAEKVRTCFGALGANRKRAVLVGGGMALLLGLGVTLGVYGMNTATDEKDQVSLGMALEALEKGDSIRARELATQLLESGPLSTQDLGGVAYVLGGAKVQEADAHWERDKSKRYLVAARHLEEARDRGFPYNHRDRGLFLLGKSLYLSGQVSDSQTPLLQALKANPRRAREIHWLLAGSYLDEPNPRLDLALKHVDHYVSADSLSASKRHQGLLKKSHILIGLGRWDEARGVLNQVPTEAQANADAIAMQGRLLMSEARSLQQSSENPLAARSKYTEAIQQFRKAQSEDTLGEQVTRKSEYLIGVCYKEMGDLQAALTKLTRVSKLYSDGDVGLAAMIDKADVERQVGKYDQAVTSYRSAVRRVDDPRTFRNPWVSLNGFRQRLLDAFYTYRKNQDFERSMQLAEGLVPIVKKDRQAELIAETHRDWGQYLLSQALEMPEEEAESQRKRARSQYRKAGYAYSDLAQRRLATRDYPQDLWNSADSFMKAQNYSRAVQVLKEYLRNEARRHRPMALVSLGRAHLALGATTESIQAFQECIDFFPQDPALYEARIWASHAYLENGQNQVAEKMLRDNLIDEGLGPKSPEWQTSLFDLGKLLHIDGNYLSTSDSEEDKILAVRRYLDSIDKLEEFVDRMSLYDEENTAQEPTGNPSKTSEALYLIAEGYRQSAKRPQQVLQNESIESVKAESRKEVQFRLESAASFYHRVLDRLNRRREQVVLTAHEEAILRNCYMLLGSVLADLGRDVDKQKYQEAIDAYKNASTLYQNQPIVLEAAVRMANCYRRIDKYVSARGALEQAKVILKRLPEDIPFTNTTNRTREQWKELLNDLSPPLATPTGAPAAAP